MAFAILLISSLAGFSSAGVMLFIDADFVLLIATFYAASGITFGILSATVCMAHVLGRNARRAPHTRQHSLS